MIEKTITFENLDGTEVTQTFHFHLTLSELMAIEARYAGGISGEFQRMQASGDQLIGYELIKTFVRESVGRKENGQFIKTPEITRAFIDSEAFSEFLLENLESPEKMPIFLNGLVSSKVRKQMGDNVFDTPQDDPGPSAPEAQGKQMFDEPEADVIEDDAPGVLTTREAMEEVRDSITGRPASRAMPPIELTRQEQLDMDPKKLRDGLVNGVYKIKGAQ